MTFRQETIDQANLVVACIEHHEEKLREYEAELVELRTLAPWCFAADGSPLPKTKAPSGRQM